MPARICVSIREATTERARDAALQAVKWADLVEIRADYIRDLDLRRLICGKTYPLLFTLRSRQEGGEYAGSERKRIEAQLEAAELGADFVDIEFSAFWKVVLASVPKSRVVLSCHTQDSGPSRLEGLMAEMASTGAGVIKIVTQAACLADNLRIARLLRAAASAGINLTAFAMGRAGIPSRVLGPLWGSWMTFASMPGGEPTAEGQIPADQLNERYRIRSIGAGTALYGVVGRPLGHTLSPTVHNAAFFARGLDALMVPLEAADMNDFLTFDREVPLQGASVTIPFKEDAYGHVRSLTAPAEHTGAVNTLIRKDLGFHGDNTDVDGFIRPLMRRRHPGRCRAVVLGAGGAARAVVYGLRSQGAAVCVVARDRGKAQVLAERFQSEHAGWKELSGLRWDLLVNATSVGMAPDLDQSPVPAEWLTGDWVYDLVYNPVETRLLREAALRGCRTVSGAEMFLGQAARQHSLWCGTPVPAEAMEEAFKAAMAAQDRPA